MKANRKKKEKLINTFGHLKNDTFNFDLIDIYFRKKRNCDASQIISDKTCNDLDLNDLFVFVDRTLSKVGQQYLYNKMRTFPADSQQWKHNERIITELSLNEDLRIFTQSQLSFLDKHEAYYIQSLFQDQPIKPPKWFFIIPFLSVVSISILILTFFFPKLIVLLLIIFIVNIFFHYWNKQNVIYYSLSIPQLLRLHSVAGKLYKNDCLKTINPDLSESLNVIDLMRKRMSFFQLEARIQNDFEVILGSVLELIKILFLFEPLLLFNVLKKIETKKDVIEHIFEYVGHIDTLISIASLRKGLEKYCIPVINNEKKELIGEQIYHPFIENCVKNSIHVREKSILLTGSNMSGKTSFIRTIGMNIISGLTLNTCFANYFSIPNVSIFSAIRISDDLMNDRSYYFEEVITIKEMIEKSEDNTFNLFLLDEIFKGTNTIERISAGKAVLSYLAKSKNIVFVSTHDIELADLLQDEYELYHFSEIVDNKTVDFDYKLKPGKLKNRNAIKILEINNYPESIIKEAVTLSLELEK